VLASGAKLVHRKRAVCVQLHEHLAIAGAKDVDDDAAGAEHVCSDLLELLAVRGAVRGAGASDALKDFDVLHQSLAPWPSGLLALPALPEGAAAFERARPAGQGYVRHRGSLN
jgi:hypothetical protein